MASPLYEFCVYTIVRRDKLDEAARSRKPKSFREAKRWVTARQLLHQAQAERTEMPIVFADAAAISRLLYWGILKQIDIDEDETEYTVRDLRPMRGRKSVQDLVLRRSGKPISANFIRPYAICRTPRFIG